MAITATNRGTGSNISAGTTVAIAPTSGNMSAGNVGIICLAIDNAGGASSNLANTVSYTDSVGNVWYVRLNAFGGTANAVSELITLTSQLTNPFTTGDSLTITFANSTTAKAWTLVEAAAGSSDDMVLFCLSGFGGSSNTASPTTTIPDMTTGELVVAMGGAESDNTWIAEADTVNGTWSTMQSAGQLNGTTAASMSAMSQQKVVTANGGQTFNPTLTIADTRLGWMVFTEVNIKARTMDRNTGSEASTVFTVRYPLSAGSIGVLCVAADNATGTATKNFPSSFNDTQSNTWTLQLNELYDPGAAAAGAELAIYTSVLTTGVTSGDSMTCTYTNASVTTKVWGMWEFAPSGAGPMSYVTGGVGSATGTGTPSVTTGTIPNGDYVIGLCAAEGVNTYTPDSGTTNGTWMTRLTGSRGSAGAAMSLISQWKQVTATATQTYAPTLTSADLVIGWIEVNDASPAGGGTGNFAGFFIQ